jgi:hypothetical protein
VAAGHSTRNGPGIFRDDSWLNVLEYQPPRTPEHAFASFRERQVVICCALQLVSSCSASYVNRWGHLP